MSSTFSLRISIHMLTIPHISYFIVLISLSLSLSLSLSHTHTHTHTHTYIYIYPTLIFLSWLSNTNYTWFPPFQSIIDLTLNPTNVIDNNSCIAIRHCGKSHLIIYYTLSSMRLTSNYISISTLKAYVFH